MGYYIWSTRLCHSLHSPARRLPSLKNQQPTSPCPSPAPNMPYVKTNASCRSTARPSFTRHVLRFFLRVERGAPTGTSSGSPKQLQITQMQTFVPSDYYAWFYEGSQWTTYVGGLAMVAIMLAGVMFPLWPPIMRLGVWYLSIGVLGLIGLFFALAIVRLIFYIITIIVAPPGIWIFPKLFADVGFVESFIPLWEWDVPKKKGKKKRSEKGKEVNGGAESPVSSARIEEVQDSGSSRPASRQARVEEVPDEEES
ncbi:hypothetical protein NUW54_g13524 [Trametes sanguinea]|uniref:Uncharacterized protein n=1 Tax=Trametes sanguinea TaxID=158606 RepID=A0ACC1MMA4_9APHY|nr:hypothetical protein NUW54_g13524 [Trametes sanguinea]